MVHDLSTDLPLPVKNLLLINDGSDNAFLTLTDTASATTSLPTAPTATTSGHQIANGESFATTIQRGHFTALSIVSTSAGTATVRMLATV